MGVRECRILDWALNMECMLHTSVQGGVTSGLDEEMHRSAIAICHTVGNDTCVIVNNISQMSWRL